MLDTLVLALRVILSAVFATAGVAKLLDRSGSRRALEDFGVATRAAGPLAVLIPLAELAVAGALIPTPTARWGAIGALVLLLAFTAGIVNALRGGREPDCHCFGQLHSAPAGPRALIRNVALAGAAAATAWLAPGPAIDEWVSDRTFAELAAVVAGAATALLAAESLRLWRENRGLRMDLAGLRTGLAANHRGLPIGADAPAFSLAGVRGEVRTLESLMARGRPVVLVFVDARCGACEWLLPKIGGWQQTLADRVTLEVISHGSAKANRRMCEEHDLPDVLLQRRSEVFGAYGVRDTPSAIAVSVGGKVASVCANTAFQVEVLVRMVLDGAQAGEPTRYEIAREAMESGTPAEVR